MALGFVITSLLLAAVVSTSAIDICERQPRYGVTDSYCRRQNPVQPSYWFSFGASYCQTGFNSKMEKALLPSVGNPIGNPEFPGKTYAGGENWVGFVTATYNKSLLFTYNYAVGGATIDRSIIDPGGSKTLNEQVDEFVAGAGGKPKATPWKSENALFSIFVGINDLQATYDDGGDRGGFAETLLTSYYGHAQRLYDAGARYFLFVAIPPVYRTPKMLAESEQARNLQRDVIIDYNRRLTAKATSFKAANPGTTIWIYDSFAHFNKMLDEPERYGFTDITNFDGKDGYFWDNDFHPGVRANNLMGQVVGRSLLANAKFWGLP